MKNFNAYLEKQLENKDLKKEYDALEPQYQMIKEAISTRQKQRLTQKELAEKMGTAQSHIARFESGNYNPSYAFLTKLANGLGKKLVVSFK